MIPKRIFQTSKKKLPNSIVRRTLRTVGDAFQYQHFNDADILKFFQDHPIAGVQGVKERFLSLRSGEHKADLFRYYYLYVAGGVYFDTDVLLVSDLKFLLASRDFVSVATDNVDGALFQGFLAAVPGHPVLLQAVRDVCEISDKELALDHHVLCKNLKAFLDDYLEKNVKAKNSTLLLMETSHSRNVAKSVNAIGETVLYHFWKRSYPPRFPILTPKATWAL